MRLTIFHTSIVVACLLAMIASGAMAGRDTRDASTEDRTAILHDTIMRAGFGAYAACEHPESRRIWFEGYELVDGELHPTEPRNRFLLEIDLETGAAHPAVSDVDWDRYRFHSGVREMKASADGSFVVLEVVRLSVDAPTNLTKTEGDLLVLDIASRRLRPLLSDGLDNTLFSISPDGAAVACYSHSPLAREAWESPSARMACRIVSLADGSVVEVAPSQNAPVIPFARPLWISDSSGFAFLYAKTREMTADGRSIEYLLEYYDIDKAERRTLLTAYVRQLELAPSNAAILVLTSEHLLEIDPRSGESSILGHWIPSETPPSRFIVHESAIDVLTYTQSNPAGEVRTIAYQRD